MSGERVIEIFLSKMYTVDRDAINVFATNAKNLLLASPAGHKIIMGFITNHHEVVSVGETLRKMLGFGIFKR